MSYKQNVNKVDSYYKQSGIAKKMLLLEGLGIGAIADYVHSGVLEDKSLLAGSSIIFTSIIYNFLKEYKRYDKYLESVGYYDNNKEVAEELRKLYDEYLAIITKIISKYKFDDNLDLCYALYLLLDDGYFSKEKEYKYYVHKLPRREDIELSSTYIIEGRGCCRHNTQFMGDILTKLNVPNYKITCTDDDKVFTVKREYHAVNGIVDEQGKYAYDFTAGNFYVIDDKNEKLFEQAYKDEEFNTSTRKSIFKIIESYDYQSTEEAEKIKSRFIDIDESYESALNAWDIAENIKDDLTKIEDVTKPLKEEIAAKSLILMPRR